GVEPHQPGVRAARQQADPGVAAQRAVGPGRGGPVLEGEGPDLPQGRAAGREGGVRTRERGVPEAPCGDGRGLINRYVRGKSSHRDTEAAFVSVAWATRPWAFSF